MNRARLPEADVEGVPALELRGEDREPVEDLVADLLVAALEREGAEATGR